MQKKQKLSQLSVLLTGIGFLLAGCGTSTEPRLTTDSLINFSWQAANPITSEIVSSGSKTNVKKDENNAQIFELLSGSIKGESKSAIMTDPFFEHNPELVQKLPLMIVSEMGLELDPNQEYLNLGGREYLVIDSISEDGIEKLVLDENPISTAKALEWTFTIDEIK